MKEETVVKLIKSTNLDDVILGLNYLKSTMTLQRYREIFTHSYALNCTRGHKTHYLSWEDKYIILIAGYLYINPINSWNLDRIANWIKIE